MDILFSPEVKGWCEQFPPGVPFCPRAGEQPGAQPGHQELVVLTLNTLQLELPVRNRNIHLGDLLVAGENFFKPFRLSDDGIYPGSEVKTHDIFIVMVYKLKLIGFS